MKGNLQLFTIKAFVIWRVLLFIFLFLGIAIIPLQIGFLGGGLTNYLKNPSLWSWINFDGEHYLAIAMRGYKPLEYFYFPLSPLVVRFLTEVSGRSAYNFAFFGLLISNLAFLTGLTGLIRLVSENFNRKIALFSLAAILFFPTSFYFGSYYTESLFFAFSVWSFYFFRNDKYVWAGILGGLSSATRIIGLAVIPAFLTAAIFDYTGTRNLRRALKKAGASLLVPIGIFLFMLFLKDKTGDPLDFLHSVSIFGAQRSSTFVTLSRVFYRYLFKILPNVDYNYFPAVFTVWMEFTVAGFFLIISLLGLLAAFRKLKDIRLSPDLAVYLFAGYLIPTLSGSFSSLPRYVIVLFPAFIVIAQYLKKLNAVELFLLMMISVILLGISTVLYTRGYFIS